MRTVIIGLGTVSRTHRKALALMDDVELVAVADVKPEKKEELPEGVHFYEDYKEMLDKEKPDAALSAFHIIFIWKQLQSVQREG